LKKIYWIGYGYDILKLGFLKLGYYILKIYRTIKG
jgi:hypothetical protein